MVNFRKNGFMEGSLGKDMAFLMNGEDSVWVMYEGLNFFFGDFSCQLPYFYHSLENMDEFPLDQELKIKYELSDENSTKVEYYLSVKKQSKFE